MRTYQSNSKVKKSTKSKRTALYIIMLCVGVIAIATTITLSLTLGGKDPALDDVVVTPDDTTQEEDQDVVAPPTESEQIFVLPMETFTVGDLCALDELVYNSSMNQYRTHDGIDLLADAGTSVFTIADGVVESITHTELDATVIVIVHDNGIVSTYKGLDIDVAVEVGDELTVGDTIGAVASSYPRESSEGPHLHLEITVDGELVDPLTILPEVGDK